MGFHLSMIYLKIKKRFSFLGSRSNVEKSRLAKCY